MLEHIAIWTRDIERLCEFYCAYFEGTAGPEYRSKRPGRESFRSRFLSFGRGCRLELMSLDGIPDGLTAGQEAVGITHLAFAVGGRAEVNSLAERARAEGVPLLLEPHETGDGYYEALVLDPDGNRVEITADAQ